MEFLFITVYMVLGSAAIVLVFGKGLANWGDRFEQQQARRQREAIRLGSRYQ